MGVAFAVVCLVLIGYVLVDLGVFSGISLKEAGGKFELDIRKPAPISSAVSSVASEEVFNVSDNKFTFEQADAVCTAYGAELASLDDIDNAFKRGASWLNYGWSRGGMALFPLQHKDYKPAERNGRPGVNGGYFDPTLKFGANCKGKKPAASQKDLDKLFNKKKPGRNNDLVQRMKDELASLRILPWDAGAWSEFGRKKKVAAPATTAPPTAKEYVASVVEKVKTAAVPLLAKLK